MSIEDDINYISCTVWEEFKDFDAWKTGDAFKEAHGGGTVGGIASMLLATARNTKGKPKAASACPHGRHTLAISRAAHVLAHD